MTPHGHFHWNELNTWDVPKAKEFYAKTLGWTYVESPLADGDTYTTAMDGDVPVAGMFPLNHGFKGMSDHWFAYVAVDDLEATLKAVQDNGGHVYREPFDVPNVGRMAVAADSVGAGLAWMQLYKPET